MFCFGRQYDASTGNLDGEKHQGEFRTFQVAKVHKMVGIGTNTPIAFETHPDGLDDRGMIHNHLSSA